MVISHLEQVQAVVQIDGLGELGYSELAQFHLVLELLGASRHEISVKFLHDFDDCLMFIPNCSFHNMTNIIDWLELNRVILREFGFEITAHTQLPH